MYIQEHCLTSKFIFYSFVVDISPMQETIAPGSSITLEIRVKALSVELLRSTLTISIDGHKEPMHVLLNGTVAASSSNFQQQQQQQQQRSQPSPQSNDPIDLAITKIRTAARETALTCLKTIETICSNIKRFDRSSGCTRYCY